MLRAALKQASTPTALNMTRCWYCERIEELDGHRADCPRAFALANPSPGAEKLLAVVAAARKVVEAQECIVALTKREVAEDKTLNDEIDAASVAEVEADMELIAAVRALDAPPQPVKERGE